VDTQPILINSHFILHTMIFAIALIVGAIALLGECCRPYKEDEEMACGRRLILVLSVVICLGTAPAPVRKMEPMNLYFSGLGRRPDHNLGSADYMMGLELAKSHTCTFFNMERDADIDRLKRCIHFFPEMRTEFVERFEEQVGFCI
jgi:hypothetical protein